MEDKLFEADIMLSPHDKERGVDTSVTGNVTGAEVEVESIAHKRKGIRSRRKIWPSRIIPVAATIDMGEHGNISTSSQAPYSLFPSGVGK